MAVRKWRQDMNIQFLSSNFSKNYFKMLTSPYLSFQIISRRHHIFNEFDIEKLPKELVDW